MQGTVELSQKEKLKKFNEKLQMMMKSKNLDKAKLLSTNPSTQQTKKQQAQTDQKLQQPKIQQKLQEKQPNLPNGQQPQNGQQDSEEQDPTNNDGQKTKKIKKDKNNKKDSNTVGLRKVAGVVWKDKSMEQWPENDYRIFVGNLGIEVSDEILSSVFRNKYNSFQMARVVVDKRTGKTKGYGFVSFKDPKDFLNALKEMNNKYIGNRPVKLTKSNWKDRALDSDRNKALPSDFQANKQKETNKICANFKYVSPY